MNTYAVIYRNKDRKTCHTGPGGAQPHFKVASEQDVYAFLQAQGCTILNIQQVSEDRWNNLLKRILNLKLSVRFGANASEYAMLCDILRALLAAGVPVLRAVKLSASESANPWLGKKLTQVVELVEQGYSLSSAMESIGRAFPVILTSAIRAGEKIGEVPKSLEKMAELFRRKAEIKRETVSAMIYPMITLIVFFTVCTVITIKIPELLREVIGEKNIGECIRRLPTVIRFLFFIKANPQYLFSPFIITGLLMVLVAIGKCFAATRLMIARMARGVPLIGTMRAEFALVDFLESVALNQESGIKIGESLALIWRTTSDALIQDSVDRVRKRIIAQGQSLSAAMSTEIVFPGLVRQMVTAAEAGGHLAEMLRPVADYYGQKARASLRRMIDFMTPGMIIMLGCVVGPVVKGVYDSLSIIQHMLSQGS